MLLTTLEVNNYEQAVEKIDWYNKRWGIEQYHKTLKSVCRIEDRQLGDRTVWQNCLAIDLVVAWRIEHIKKLARTQPLAPCTIAFGFGSTRTRPLRREFFGPTSARAQRNTSMHYEVERKRPRSGPSFLLMVAGGRNRTDSIPPATAP